MDVDSVVAVVVESVVVVDSVEPPVVLDVVVVDSVEPPVVLDDEDGVVVVGSVGQMLTPAGRQGAFVKV